MKPLQRLLPPNASRICNQCRRTFSSTPSRAEDMLDSLSRSLKGQPATTTATTTYTPSTPSTPRSGPRISPAPSRSALEGMRQVLSRAAQTPSLNPQVKKEEENIVEGVLAGINKKDAEEALDTQMARRWRAGDVYSLHDLGAREGAIWHKLHRRPSRDVFEMVGEDPIKHYKNMPLLSSFVTETGRIKHSNITGLKPKNQRKLAKAIRRAIGSGLMPSVHRHPEVIAAALKIEKYRTPPYGGS